MRRTPWPSPVRRLRRPLSNLLLLQESWKSCPGLCSRPSATGRLTRPGSLLTVRRHSFLLLLLKSRLHPVAPVIMTPRMMNAAAASSSRRNDGKAGGASHQLGFTTLGRSPMRLSLGSRRVTSRDLQIVEAAPELLQEDVPEPEGIASDVSLLRGFKATIPSATKGRMRRRQARNVDVSPLGLKKLGSNVRSLPDEDLVGAEASQGDDVVLIGKKKGKWKPKRRGRQSLGAGIAFGKEELERQTDEIIRDKENVHVRRVSIVNVMR
jgi:mitochondrial division protein 1